MLWFIGRVKFVSVCDCVMVSLLLTYAVYFIHSWTSAAPTSGVISQDDSWRGIMKDHTKAKSLMSGETVKDAGNDSDPYKLEHPVVVTVNKTASAEKIVQNMCPDKSLSLKGDIEYKRGQVTLAYLKSHYPDVEPGGRIRPLSCKPGQRVALIVPFRNNYNHLHTLLDILIPVLQRQQVDVTFFVIQQTNDTSFNRACLFNIGFLEALQTAEFDCFIFHNVDLVPLNDFLLYMCGTSPVHFVAKIMSSYEAAAKETYTEYNGGTVAMTRSQYEAVNGHSNLYFGWGGEDDDLYRRILKKNLKRERANSDWGVYQLLDTPQSEVLKPNPQRFDLLRSATKRQNVEGLNTTKYKVKEIKKEHFYTNITVSLNKKEIFMTAPTYTLNDIAGDLAK